VMGERFWYGLGIIAAFSTLAFAVVWTTAH
jgi:hypothetical protein